MRLGAGRPALAVSALALAAFARIVPAAAGSTCDGSYAATLLQPLPTPMVVGLDVRDDSPANERLAARFLAGLREAGVTVGEPPNVVLHIGTLRVSGGGREQAGETYTPYSEWSGEEGGLQRDVPGVFGTPLATRTPAAAPLLTLRIEATAGQAPRIAWVVAIQCQIVGSDDGARAQEIGRAIGPALGQRVERRPL
jgi:hypothetical protein